MKFASALIAVKDMERTVKFYDEVLGIKVENDFGANVVFEGGFCAQTLDTWKDFIQKDTADITFGSLEFELYFEEKNFDEFIEVLSKREDIKYVHKTIEHSWGQRGVRFFDPDGHVIEVGESLGAVCRRFINAGMNVAETAKRMDVTEAYVNFCLEDK